MIACRDFCNFVVIRLETASRASIEYKSLKSFHDSTRGSECMPLSDLLNIWAATMIDEGLAPSSRKRYLAKLAALYKEYCAGNRADDDPFDAVKPLCDRNRADSTAAIRDSCVGLCKIFGQLLDDSESRPALAVFLYMLFEASSEIEKSILLKVDDYAPRFAQLDGVIDTKMLHHRRKYVFGLNQSQKRMPQLVREVCSDVEKYMRARGISLPGGFCGTTAAAFWIAKARKTGLSLSDIKAVMAGPIPPEYDYLSLVRPAIMTSAEIQSVKRRVADAFFPATNRWFAMKLRPGRSFDSLCSVLKGRLPECFQKIEFFYPTRIVVKREGKKIQKTQVPFIPDIVFFNIHPCHVAAVDHAARTSAVGWVFRIVNAPGADYSVIDGNSMFLFEKAVGQFSTDMDIGLSDRLPVEIGRQVRITGGIMSGYEGTIYDIKGDGSEKGRLFCIELSSSSYLRLRADVEEFYIEPLRPGNGS